MTFLPKEYEIPKTASNYMKFADGLNQIRVLDSAITGYEYWNKDNKPIRSKINWQVPPKNARLNKDNSFTCKHFWAFPVWNYNAKKVQILEITQITIMKAMKALISNPKWGDPKKYDIAIIKEGEKLETIYTIQAEPPIAEPTTEITEAYNKVNINLDNLFDNSDPFDKSKSLEESTEEFNVEDIEF